jgi:pimeloyl-ACP methyl ester carboxylesterase
LRFPFVLSRRRNVRWFQDLYSYNFARYPDASFYFIGHSYGTYILGRSMARVPAMRFHRIVLVGSVLPREYRWSDRIDSGQADEIRNERSSSDIPVKVLCSALHAFGRDVGTGGVDGFDEGRCREVFFYKGNHGRPLDRDNLPALADYLMNGTYVPPGGLIDDISPTLGVVARLAPAIGIVIICTLLFIIPGIWWVYKASGVPAAIGATLLVVLIAVILDAI